MTDDRRTGDTLMDAQIEALMSDSRNTDAHPDLSRPGSAPREALDREEQLIRDSVLRMGALVEAAIREASVRWSRTMRRSRST